MIAVETRKVKTIFLIFIGGGAGGDLFSLRYVEKKFKSLYSS